MGPISDCFFRRHWNRPNYRIKSDKDLTVRRCAKISRLSSVSGFEHGEEARSRRGWRCAPHGCTSGGLKLSPIRVLSVCLLVPDRYNCLDGRASHHGIDFEPPLHRRRDVELHRGTAALLEALDIMAKRQRQPRFVE